MHLPVPIAASEKENTRMKVLKKTGYPKTLWPEFAGSARQDWQMLEQKELVFIHVFTLQLGKRHF